MRLLALSVLLLLVPLSFAGVIWSTSATDAVEGLVVAQGKAIFTSYDGSIYAADAKSGQLAWVYDSGSRISLAPQLLDYDTLAAATDDGRLLLLSATDGRLEASAALNGTPLSLGSGLGMAFVGSSNGIAAYSKAGAPIWSRNFSDGVGQIGYGDNDIYFVSGTSLYSLAAISGSEAWSAPMDESFLSAPSEYGGNVYVGATDGKLYSFDYVSGNRQWTYQTGGWVMSTPSATTTSVYFGSNDGYFYSVSLSGEGNWKFRTGEAIWSEPLIHQTSGGLLAVFGSNDGNIYALDTQTGNQVWAFSAGGKPTALVEYNGSFIFGTSGGKVYSISASPVCSFTWPASGDVVGNWSVDVEGTAHSDSGLQEVDVRLGSGPWETATGSDVWYAPVDFSQVPPGSATVQCRASDASGAGRETDYSSLQLVVSDSAGTQNMIISSPQQVAYNESFQVSAEDQRGKEIHSLEVKVGDAAPVLEDSPMQLTLGRTGPVQISLSKPGFADYDFAVTGSGGPSPMLPLLALAALVALAYFFLRKKLPAYFFKK